MQLPQPTATHAEPYRDLHLVVDFECQVAYLDGLPLKLTAKAFALLAFLVRHPGELVIREKLLLLVWGYSPEIRTRTLDVHIRRIRKHLGKYSNSYVETVFGVGYRFQPCRTQAPVENKTLAATLSANPSTWQWKMEGNPAY
jgi:DNA-binding response OmpR family regulator